MTLLLFAQALFAVENIAQSDRYTRGLFAYLGLSFILSMFQYALGTTLTSESTSRVPDDSKGTLLGLEHSLFAAARVFAPIMGSSLLISSGSTGVSAASGLIFLSVAFLWNFFYSPTQTKGISSEKRLQEGCSDGCLTVCAIGSELTALKAVKTNND